MNRNKNRGFRHGVMRILAVICLVVLQVLGLAACASSAKLVDGVYTGASTPDEYGGWAEVVVTVSQGKVSDCSYILYENESKVKDESYGKDLPPEQYEMAQTALSGAKEYPRQFVESGSLDGITAVTGATASMNQFKELIGKILEEASEK